MPDTQELQAEIERLRGENDELNALFDLRWKADMRAIARWREQDPEARQLRQPDHADLCVFLLQQLAACERRKGRNA